MPKKAGADIEEDSMKKKKLTYMQAALLGDVERALLEETDEDSPELIALESRIAEACDMLLAVYAAIANEENKSDQERSTFIAQISRICARWWEIGVIEGRTRQRLGM